MEESRSEWIKRLAAEVYQKRTMRENVRDLVNRSRTELQDIEDIKLELRDIDQKFDHICNKADRKKRIRKRKEVGKDWYWQW